MLLVYFPCLVLCIVLFVFKQHTWSFSDNFSLVIFSYSLPQQHPQSYLINRDVMTSLHNNSKYHHRKHHLINDTITAKMKTSAPEHTQWIVLCLVEQIIFFSFFSLSALFCFALLFKLPLIFPHCLWLHARNVYLRAQKYKAPSFRAATGMQVHPVHFFPIVLGGVAPQILLYTPFLFLVLLIILSYSSGWWHSLLPWKMSSSSPSVVTSK